MVKLVNLAYLVALEANIEVKVFPSPLLRDLTFRSEGFVRDDLQLLLIACYNIMNLNVRVKNASH